MSVALLRIFAKYVTSFSHGVALDNTLFAQAETPGSDHTKNRLAGTERHTSFMR